MERLQVKLGQAMVDFETALMLMDDEILEGLRKDGFESPQIFMDRYAAEHRRKFGEDFGSS